MKQPELWFWFFILLVTVVAFMITLIPCIRVRSTRRSYWLTLGLVFVMPFLALSLYWHWGAWRAQEHYWRSQKTRRLVEHDLALIKSPQQLISCLQATMHKRPFDAKGWYLLGKLYLKTGADQRAVVAFSHAVTYAANNVDYKAALVEAEFFANHKQLTQRGRVFLKQVLAKDSHNITANNLLAIDAYQRQDYQRAIALWESLLDDFPPNSQDATLLYNMIAKAQKAL